MDIIHRELFIGENEGKMSLSIYWSKKSALGKSLTKNLQFCCKGPELPTIPSRCEFIKDEI